MKLFMFYIGGDCGNSNIELHDVRFSIGETAEDCRDDLRNQWWGDPKSLHLDCWGAVEQADGYDVTLTTELLEQAPATKLFFVNLGGYDPTEFGELHRNILLVASDAKAATKKALQQIRNWKLPHKDNVFEVEKAVDVTELMGRYGYRLKLTEATSVKPFGFTCAYIRIGV
ncbi:MULTISPECIES: DUF1543 domain-containing protein [unclassified Rhizobium]|uniref:DUF1543 domain-containing protein n=1 Tax=unclassified Rhizobium TaxID=2613769 RepID=UPI001ADA923D|nr:MULTISPECIES: DUF1543 domain-containing protein [unclassified Rhizobium]MBO9101139.1 DUF1543 domain-containing protein [Rhizobium sp. L58/93]MBO9168403.1 DUF1543 domain-containing protein [Rhizobium sp. L245/93]QXZ88204.1 DUF1543 domain-containing protein [Rhizobium sp. K1/93]QXZ94378.1 DUF1543 domain-containing protein [Rhizobium sp. K15/93]QYA05728.1 DUF1543 domain-containing protein [Rhizobium sp. B21/90]